VLHFEGGHRVGIEDTIAFTEVITEQQVGVAIPIDVREDRRVGQISRRGAISTAVKAEADSSGAPLRRNATGVRPQ
jgi:hypothetical protein